MRGVEEFVRATQTQEPRAPRGALLRPAAPPVRALSGSVAAHRPQVQTPFESYVAVGEGGPGQGEVTPLPVGHVTLLDHSSGSPIDISQTSSVVLRMNSRLHIFPFTVSARNVGGDRVWKCDVFIEPGAVQQTLGTFSGAEVFDVDLSPEGNREFVLSHPIPFENRLYSSISVRAEWPFFPQMYYFTTEGVHFEITPVDQEYVRGIYPGLDVSVFPQAYLGVVRLLPKYFEDFGNNTTKVRILFTLITLPDTVGHAYSQITSQHGDFRGYGGLLSAPSYGIFPAQDSNGNSRIPLSKSQTAQFDLIGRKDDSDRPMGRRSWVAQLVYFERSDQWLCSSGGVNPLS